MNARGGNVLQALAVKKLQAFYNPGLFFQPPAFPLALLAASRLFDSRLDLIHQGAQENRSDVSFEAPVFQFPRVAVPLGFSALAVVATFLIGRKLFDSPTAWIAAFLLVLAPTDIAYSQALLPATMLEGLAAASVAGLVCAIDARRQVHRLALALASGLATGMCLLTDAMGLAVIPVVCAWLLASKPGSTAERGLLIAVTTLGTAVLLTLSWYARASSHFGSALFLPGHVGPLTRGFEAINALPWTHFFVALIREQAMVLLIPLWPLAIVTDPKRRLLVLWIAAVFLTFLVEDWRSDFIGKEARHYLMAYPAVFLLLARGLREGLRGPPSILRGKLAGSLLLVATLAFGVIGALRTCRWLG